VLSNVRRVFHAPPILRPSKEGGLPQSIDLQLSQRTDFRAYFRVFVRSCTFFGHAAHFLSVKNRNDFLPYLKQPTYLRPVERLRDGSLLGAA
jgi:hypothetical protein